MPIHYPLCHFSHPDNMGDAHECVRFDESHMQCKLQDNKILWCKSALSLVINITSDFPNVKCAKVRH